METITAYTPAEIEQKWYDYWMEHRLFRSTPDTRPPYTIVIPPPNVTGVLHMGHMLNNTLQDVLIRRARMKGFNALWVPGTDHASIATEAKVVQKLKSEGIEKNDLSRDEFLKHAWEWTEKHGGIILKQLRKLGASCDWERTAFTMDEARSESVIRVFVDLYNKGKIYRGVRMVNWDPSAKTAVSDEEVIHREVHGKLYYLRYRLEGSDRYVVVATTRPETIMGDVAVSVNPADPRYADLQGKKVIVPLVNRTVPVIADDYVDIEFGTGVLKITPAHDVNDYMLGEKYGLETIDVFNDDGTINERGGLYVGMDRFAVRQQIAEDLEAAGLMEKVEDYTNKVGFSERTNAVIEPKLSMQWFLAMKEISEPALRAVMEDAVRLIPEKFKNTYRHWMENVRDWNISRQLWWGHRIPAYYLPEGGFVVAETEEQALELARSKTGNPALQIADLRQDEDVLDTWFSSWLWPISVFDGIRHPDNADIRYYYPTSDLVTAPEILFFWVARMIIAGYEYRGERPFNNVYLTGIVRDKQRRKMSKSLGNSPDPLELIATYGADGVRVGMLLCSAAGNDLMYDDALVEQGRNFANKVWNAFRLVQTWQVDETLVDDPAYRETTGRNNAIATEWFGHTLSRAIEEIESDFDQYRISEALMRTYKLFWDEFSGWYLELVKPAYQQPIDGPTYRATLGFFEKLLQLLHPFTPFFTEEIWHRIGTRADGESIMLTAMPQSTGYDSRLLAEFDGVKETITAIRNIRRQKNIPNREALTLYVKPDENYRERYNPVVMKMANLSSIEETTHKIDNASAFIIKSTEYFVPLGDNLNIEEELTKLKAALEYQQGFLRTVMAKLNNERFVAGAPAQVVAGEQAKKADAEAKIAALQQQIAQLS
ncbi:MAG: valine--tRNA ligase [Rikenellaceae bacterium]|jgi:valyl-tRNA synthetase|nr:valine--tRNA ligase [Rikenellaceae bacterium]